MTKDYALKQYSKYFYLYLKYLLAEDLKLANSCKIQAEIYTKILSELEDEKRH